MSNRYPDGMTPDDWDYVEGTGKYAEDYDEEAERRYAEGPDPDDINDQRREKEYADADMVIDPEAMEGN